MLKIENVSKYYGNILAVDNLSFEIKEGEIFGLLGVNGAGKTTTFRMIIGLLDKSSGNITLNGKPIDYSVTDKVGFLTEERSLLLRMSVLEQAIFYGSLKGMKEDEIINKLDYYLDKFDIKDYKNRKIKELSKGNQQKVQFIIAILNDPKLLILDEPFSGLDPINIELFKNEILEFKKKGTIIIFSTHRMDHAEFFCDNLVVLLKGKAVLSGSLEKIKKDYKKKNILIKGDVSEVELKSINGVLSVTKKKDEYIVKINDDKCVKEVFNYISKKKIIEKFVVEEASLEEIFIAKVGETYEK
ncbi:MAG: ATP-binding cassette domain-containing protein [Bacilli bacterium]